MSLSNRGRLTTSSLLLAALLIPTAVPAADPTAGQLAAAQEALAAGRFADAEAGFSQILEREPGLLEAHLGLARALRGSERPDQAAAVLVGLGEGLLQARQYERAAAVLGEAAAIRPQTATIRSLWGRALLLQQDPAGAARELERAIALGDGNPGVRFYLGTALWESGQIAEAEAVLRELVARTGGAFLALHQLGRLLHWQGRSDEAVPYLRRALTAKPGSADTLLDLAHALEATDDTAAALETYQRLVAVAPGSFKAHYGLALLLSRLGRRQEAAAEMKIYQQLYAAEQERTQLEGLERARLDRGWELFDAGDLAAARSHFAELPASSESLAGLAVACSAAGDHAGAVEALEGAVSLAPDSQDLRLRLAEERLAVTGDS